ncbi:transcriptional repressor LexA [Hyphococcus luteus]|uniref:LexA repressor n=1 Tax=Hyphococcus luteus TaxID=2058213 RepID=A0A2S7JYL7_9PROT|nr:transcriptional repressor LexA [Marinicaulis flavus]PQA85339.1 repressor LexA [Marinicaulis flavus]
MLTKKQHELLVFINDRLTETGVSPSFDEMKEALDLRSKSGIHRLITALEERGFIRRLPHRARALEILKMPEGAKADPAPAPAQRGFKPAVVDGDFKRRRPEIAPRAAAPAGAGSVDLPVLGRIAAGTPIEAIQHEVDRFNAPDALIGKGDHYILEVQGESMINAGIQDGDYVIIKRCSDAENGAIVVALVDDEEATLKRLRRKGASVALEAANPDFETRIYGPDRVAVQGKLVGLMRSYH